MIIGKGAIFSSGTGSQPWTPLDLDLYGWHDPSQTGTITESGGDVSQVDDLSGNANHLTQGSAGGQPVTGVQTINGLNVIDYQTSNHRLLTPQIDMGSVGDFSFYWIMQPVSAPSNTSGMWSIFETTSNYLESRTGSTINEFLGPVISANPAVLLTLPNSPYSGGMIFGVRYNITTEVAEVRVNGTAVSNQNVPYDTAIGGLRTLVLANNRLQTNGAIMYGGEDLFFKDVDDSSINNVEGYLSTKWGIAI